MSAEIHPGRGFDCAANLHDWGGAIVEAGYSFVGRYFAKSSRIPGKILTPQEAKHLTSPEVGLFIVSLYEGAGDHLSYFNNTQGLTDGRVAWAQAQAVGQPFGTPIYYCVDFDPTTTEIHQNVKNYFAGVRDALEQRGDINETDNYLVGVYGSGAVCQYLTDIGFVSYTWLAQAYGWNGSQEFKDSDSWDILQEYPSVTWNGFDIDTDVSNGRSRSWRSTLNP